MRASQWIERKRLSGTGAGTARRATPRGITDAEGKTVRVFTGAKAQALKMFHEDEEA